MLLLDHTDMLCARLYSSAYYRGGCLWHYDARTSTLLAAAQHVTPHSCLNWYKARDNTYVQVDHVRSETLPGADCRLEGHCVL